MNVVDSSGWLEYLADGLNAEFFAGPIRDLDQLLVPTLSLYEVFKRVLQQRSESEALGAIAIMQQGQLVDLTEAIALSAAKTSVDHRMPMADSIMLATARLYNATLWTQDTDFENIEGVEFIPKKSS